MYEDYRFGESVLTAAKHVEGLQLSGESVFYCPKGCRMLVDIRIVTFDCHKPWRRRVDVQKSVLTAGNLVGGL